MFSKTIELSVLLFSSPEGVVCATILGVIIGVSMGFAWFLVEKGLCR